MSAASILLVVSLVSQVGALPDQPARDHTPKPAGTASISGRVVSADSGLPLRRAHVSISGPTFRNTETDAEGRYSLAGLSAGRLLGVGQCGAHRGGYLGGGYGTTLAQGPWGSAMTRGRPIEVADRAHVTDIDIRLERAGAIAGRVVDTTGEPVTRIQVRVIRMQRGLQPATFGMATTDDLGAFRVFGLQPGDYVVAADSRMIDTSRSGDGRNTIGFAPTYAPATASLDRALRIRVTPGATVTADVQLTETRLYSISGVALTSTGDPPKSAGISVVRADSPVEDVSYGASVSATGSFAVQNVPPGSYVITMRTTPDPARPTESKLRPLPSRLAMPISKGVALLSKPGATITGQIVYDDGISERRKASITVSSTDRPSIRPDERRDRRIHLHASECVRCGGAARNRDRARHRSAHAQSRPARRARHHRRSHRAHLRSQRASASGLHDERARCWKVS